MGECYVTVDGHEADLDLGHYERFLNVQTTRANNITTGRIYQSVINKEAKGLLGKDCAGGASYHGRDQAQCEIAGEINTNLIS